MSPLSKLLRLLLVTKNYLPILDGIPPLAGHFSPTLGFYPRATLILHSWGRVT